VVPFDSVWYVVVEKGTYHAPMDVQTSVRVLPPDRQILSSIAADAPDHVRTQVLLDEGEATALSQGGQSEG
jgi:hypothetical protein